jgi:hypothetical protein
LDIFGDLPDLKTMLRERGLTKEWEAAKTG